MKRNSEIHTRVVYLKSTLRVYFRGYKLKSRPGYESITFALPPPPAVVADYLFGCVFH